MVSLSLLLVNALRGTFCASCFSRRYFRIESFEKGHSLQSVFRNKYQAYVVTIRLGQSCSTTVCNVVVYRPIARSSHRRIGALAIWLCLLSWQSNSSNSQVFPKYISRRSQFCRLGLGWLSRPFFIDRGGDIDQNLRTMLKIEETNI